MTKYTLMLQIGSSFCAIAASHADFFVKEPSVVAVDTLDKSVKACGNYALKLASSGMANVELVHPILEGTVSDTERAKELFRSLFAKVLPQKAKLFPDTKVTCAVMCSLNSADKATIENVLLSLGIKTVSFCETPLCDSVELFRQFHTNRGIIVDIGSDCADCAVVYADTIVTGCTVYFAGKALTQAVAKCVRDKYLLQLPFSEAEKLKIKCASLYSNDTSNCTVFGCNADTGENEKVTITSRELYNTVSDFCRKYVKVINGLLNSAPDEIGNMIKQEGVMLCGGGACLEGLESFLHGELDLPVRLADDCKDVTVRGAKQL